MSNTNPKLTSASVPSLHKRTVSAAAAAVVFGQLGCGMRVAIQRDQFHTARVKGRNMGL